MKRDPHDCRHAEKFTASAERCRMAQSGFWKLTYEAVSIGRSQRGKFDTAQRRIYVAAHRRGESRFTVAAPAERRRSRMPHAVAASYVSIGVCFRLSKWKGTQGLAFEDSPRQQFGWMMPIDRFFVRRRQRRTNDHAKPSDYGKQTLNMDHGLTSARICR